MTAAPVSVGIVVIWECVKEFGIIFIVPIIRFATAHVVDKITHILIFSDEVVPSADVCAAVAQFVM